MEFKKLPSGLYAVIIDGHIHILTQDEFEKIQGKKYSLWWQTVKRKYLN